MARAVTARARRWHDRGVTEDDSALQRLGNLCSYLDADAELCEVLEKEGRLAGETWERLAEAAGNGDVESLTPLLDAVDRAGRTAGVDGITYTTRAYRVLPGPVAHHTVTGWRCPQQVVCGRVELAADQSLEHRCTLTGELMTWASVSSG